MSDQMKVLMVSPDGTKAYVPSSGVEGAIADGAQVGVRMTAPDGTKGVVPFANQDAAQKDGATWDVSPDNDNTKTYMTWRQQAIAARPTDLLGNPANTPLAPPENLGQGPTIGGASDPSVKLTNIPFAKKLFNAVGALDDAANFTQQGAAAHPIQAELGQVVDRLKGFLFGGAANPENAIGTGQYGMLTNPVTSSLIPGAEGEPAAYSALKGAASIGKQAFSAVTGAPDAIAGAAKSAIADTSDAVSSMKPQIVDDVMQGEGAAQSPAKAALQSGADASAADAGVVADSADANSGIRTLMQKPIEAAKTAEDALYGTVNDAAETDMKDLYDYKAKLEDALEAPENIGNRKNLTEELKTTNDSIATGEANVQSKLGEDASGLIDQAKAATQQRYAMEELDKKLFNANGVIKGNVAHGAPESININAAIDRVENLDQVSKFAPRGTPTRLQQALGEKGAAALKQGLYDAQAAGKTALKRQDLAKLVGARVGKAAITAGAAALGGGAALHFLGGKP